MTALIWAGTALTLVGVAILAACIGAVLRARRVGLSEDLLRDRLRRVLAWNLGALAVSAIGLMAVVTGLLLG